MDKIKINTAKELTELKGELTAACITTRYVYTPSTKADKKIIKEGNLPTRLHLFINVLRREGYDVEYKAWDYIRGQFWFDVTEDA